MSLHKVTIVVCDVPGCGGTFDHAERLGENTRAKAIREGWLHVFVRVRRGLAPSRDFCPLHIEEGRAWEASVRETHPHLEGDGAVRP